MEILNVKENKEKYMDLLLLADESENMINKYLNDGELFALYDNDLKTVCVVIKIDEKTCEIKNIATYEKYHKNGYGTIMLKYVIENYKNKCEKLLIGTGDNERILSFYRKFGFNNSHVIKDFFIKNYDHEMFEDGKQLRDMVYLERKFK
jgi:ribosomal protein S18 acetylase RimI-like enzyme